MPRLPRKKSSREPDATDELVDLLIKQVADPRELLEPNGLLKSLLGRVVERCLDSELSEHLGYEKGQTPPTENTRNGSTTKTLKTALGEVVVDVPRDRDGSFEPQLVKKHQRRLDTFDERIISLYGRGMSVRDIQDYFSEAYGAEVSPTLISRITDAVSADVEEWRNRRLEQVYPILYLDGLVVKVRENGHVHNHTVHIAMGIDKAGKKDVLGLWMADTEGAKFWLQVLTDLKNRGVEDVLIVCCDGLKGFPQAVAAAFPKSIVQTCIVHMVRHSLDCVSYTGRSAVAGALKAIYTADTLEQAVSALDEFERVHGKKYPAIVRSWRLNWELICPFFRFPEDIRRAIYTTNPIEAVNRQLRKVLKTKGALPSVEATYKLLWMTLNNVRKSWRVSIPNWQLALQQFAIHFDNRLDP
jgi:putative transposase